MKYVVLGVLLVGLGRESAMPIGLQLVGPEFSDLSLIDVARLLRDECGFGFRPPPPPFGLTTNQITDTRTSKL
jgi:hypothetical protein